MPPSFDSCCHAFQVGAHDIAYPADVGISPEGISLATTILPAILHGLQRYIQTDFVSVFKTIGHSFRRGIDIHKNAVDAMAFQSLRSGIPLKNERIEGADP